MKALTENQLRELLYEAYNKGYSNGATDGKFDLVNDQHSLIVRDDYINEMMTKV